MDHKYDFYSHSVQKFGTSLFYRQRLNIIPLITPPSPPLYLQEYLDTPSMIFEKFEPPINKE